MDNTGYLEYIIPIIFFAIWVIGKIFGKKEAKEEGTDSEDAKVYPYPLKEQYEKVSDSVNNQANREQGRSILYQREQKEIEQREYSEEKLKRSNLRNTSGIMQSVKKNERNEQRSALLNMLQDSNSLRKAFLISEVLGTPVALRYGEKEKSF